MGSPAFAVPSLEALVGAGYQVVAVVTQPDRPSGRGGRVTPPEAKLAAVSLGLPVLQPESLKDEFVQAELAALSPDLIVVAAYGKILPKAVLALPRRGCVNVHGSLLPRWRGASPVAAAVLAGDAETGVSIMEMVPKMDAGPVIATAREPVGPEDTTATLEPRLATLGARLLVDVLPAWYRGDLPPIPQDESRATYCGLIRKEDGHLRAAMTAAEAERAVRAYDPWPGAFVLYRGERLAIWKARVAANAPARQPGTLGVVDGLPALGLAGGELLLEEVQRPGGRRMGGVAFLNGERGRLEASVVLA
jgi:methionyl-tRNA formyltransferase